MCDEKTLECNSVSLKCKDTFCKETEYCEKETQTCKIQENVCSNVTCGLGQICDSKTGKCSAVEKICDPAFEKCDDSTITSTSNDKKSIGNPCKKNEDCEGNLCLLDQLFPSIKKMLLFSDGYCSQTCGVSCPDFSVCLKEVYNDAQYCVKKCTIENECRENYTCQKIDTQTSACIPKTQMPVDVVIDDGIGKPCQQDADCVDNLSCFTDEIAFPSGYCSKPNCETSDCPLSSKCVPYLNTTLCMKTCTLDNMHSCRDEYGCARIHSYISVKNSQAGTCKTDKDCAESGYCDPYHQCYRKCAKDIDCGQYEGCREFVGADNTKLFLCAKHQGICASTAFNAGCSSNAECGSCKQGGDNICSFLFGSKFSCDETSFSCQRTCTTLDTSSCDAKELCNPQGFCAYPCMDDNECSSKKCALGFCTFQTMTCNSLLRSCVQACNDNNDCFGNGTECNTQTGECEIACNHDNHEFCGSLAECNAQTSICERKTCGTLECDNEKICASKNNTSSFQLEACLPKCVPLSLTSSNSESKHHCPNGFTCSDNGLCTK